MKILLLCIVIAVSISSVIAGDGDVFDKMDVKAILNDREQLLAAYNCLMDRGPCGKFQAIRGMI